jgi:hypothetical protein
MTSIRRHGALCVAALAIAANSLAAEDVVVCKADDPKDCTTAAALNEQIARANAQYKRDAAALPFDYRDLVHALLVEYIRSHSFPGPDHEYFLGVFGDDADAALVAQLHESGIDVRPASAWTFPGGQQVKASPRIRITVGAIKQVAPDTFSIRIGYYCGTLCAASENYKLQKDGNGWRVVDRQQDWIA